MRLRRSYALVSYGSLYRDIAKITEQSLGIESCRERAMHNDEPLSDPSTRACLCSGGSIRGTQLPKLAVVSSFPHAKPRNRCPTWLRWFDRRSQVDIEQETNANYSSANYSSANYSSQVEPGRARSTPNKSRTLHKGLGRWPGRLSRRANAAASHGRPRQS